MDYQARAIAVATTFVRRMRGGAQAHLIKANDGCYYVVKSPANPQGTRILINEWIANHVMVQLGVSTPPIRVVRIDDDFILASGDLSFYTAKGSWPMRPGYHLGSLYKGVPDAVSLYDYLPAGLVGKVSNVSDFTGALVCDKWMANSDYRQALFIREKTVSCGPNAPSRPGFRAWMIDNGNVFDGAKWRFTDTSVGCRYHLREVYNYVRGWSDFERWFEGAREIARRTLEHAVLGIPRDWLVGHEVQLDVIIERLRQRVHKLPHLIDQLRTVTQPRLFANWC